MKGMGVAGAEVVRGGLNSLNIGEAGLQPAIEAGHEVCGGAVANIP